MKKRLTKKEMMALRTKKTLLGRTLCRLAGDQAGGVMMEYVIIGVLVAAAAVLIVTLFGKQIVNGFSVMIYGVTGQNDKAETKAVVNQSDAVTDETRGEKSRSVVAPGK